MKKATKPFLIIIDGPMASGKTTIAELLHKKIKRTAFLGIDRIKWFISDYKRNFSDTKITRDVLLVMCKEYVKHRINLLIAQGFWKEEFMLPFIKFAKKRNLNLFVYQLTAPKEILLERFLKRPAVKAARRPITKSRLLKNLKTWEVHKYSNAKVFNTDTTKPEAIVKEILKEIRVSKH